MDALLEDGRMYLEADMETSAVLDVLGGDVTLFTRGGPHKEGPNEDAAAILISGTYTVLAVADGVGGSRAGSQASRIALETLRDALPAEPESGDAVRDAILTGIERANEAVCALGLGAGTTLAVAVIENGTVRTFHVGDSEILLVGQRGRVKLHTVSHSPVSYAVEAGLLDAREALLHEDRNVILNMIGVPDMRVEMTAPVELAAYDTLLLGTDGLFDNLHLDEIIATVRKGPLDELGEELRTVCEARMRDPRDGQPSKSDDLTYLAYRRRR